MTKVKEYMLELMIMAGIIILGLVFTSAFRDDTPSEGEILDRMQQEKQMVLDQLVEGKILYRRSKNYKKFDSSRISNPDAAWVGPEHKLGEAWMGADANGNTSFQIGVSRTLQGELLTVSKWEGGRWVSTWIPTGKEMTAETGADSLTTWVEGIWGLHERYLDNGWTYIERGELNGERSVILENQYATTKEFSPEGLEYIGTPVYASTVSQEMVNRIEFVEITPLIRWSSLWELSEEGKRTLVEERRVIEYQMLPADIQIGPFQ
ncbi:MAG: hypothetical protein O2783_00120 [Chloroflexi bacterium]|nr:hypothetical protein [Chloroflexota bacterium]